MRSDADHLQCATVNLDESGLINAWDYAANDDVDAHDCIRIRMKSRLQANNSKHNCEWIG